MDDLISRQAAISAISQLLEPRFDGKGGVTYYVLTKTIVSETLRSLPSAQPEPCEDAVSRANLRLMKTEECAGHTIEYAMGWKACIEWIKTLPSVQSERKVGEWVKARGSWCTPGGDEVWECSECGKGTHVYGIEHSTYGSDVSDGQWVACPNCGAYMGGSNETT